MKLEFKIWMIALGLVISNALYAQSIGKTQEELAHQKIEFFKTYSILTNSVNQIDINSIDGNIALYNAIRFNLPESVSALIERGVDINKVLDKEWLPGIYATNISGSPIALASYYGNTEIVEILINAGVNVNVKASDNLSVIECAMEFDRNYCLNNKQSECNKIKGKSYKIFKVGPYEKPNDIQSALIAEFKKTVDLTFLVIQSTLEFEKYNLTDHNSILDSTLISQIYDDYVMYLKQSEALYQLSAKMVKPKVPTDFNAWFANAVASNETIKVINSLISGGVNVNERGKSGRPALILAIDKKEYEIATLLIKAGADINLQEQENSFSAYTRRTALMIAVSRGSLDIVDQLKEAGADLEIKDKSGWTALTYAIKHGQVEIAKQLITEGAVLPKTVKVKNEEISPIFIANNEMTVYLIELGYDINSRDANGNTKLIRACDNLIHRFKNENTISTYKSILKAGANVKIENNKNETALWLVAKVHSEIVYDESKKLIEPYAKLLVDNGAGEAELIKAYSEGNYEYAFCMLYAGKVDVNKTDAEGNSLYSKASKALKNSSAGDWAMDWLKDMLKEAKKGDVQYRKF